MPRTHRLAGAILLLTLAWTAPASAQQQPAGDVPLESRWHALLSAVLAERHLHLEDQAGNPVAPGPQAHRLAGDPEAVRAAYAEVLARLVADPALQPVFRADRALVDQTVRPADRAWIARLAESGAGAKDAKSVNASSTNPAAPSVAERSGFSDLVALALDSRNVLAANESAVSVNLNALAIAGLRSDVESAPARYRRYGPLRRLGGTFTFGAKVPEGEITGLTGLPSAANLLDAIAWDVRVRVYGDRDPRAQRWYDVMLGVLGGLNEVNARVLSLVPIGDLSIVQPMLQDQLGVGVAAVRRQLNRSAQVTVKGAGQHLTNERGRNRYTAGVLADQGFGDTDLTFNTLLSIVDDVSLGSQVFSLKTWTLAFGLNHLTARDLLVRGRAIELSANATVAVPFGDDDSLPIARERMWHIVGAVTLPWGDAAKIPVSVTFTSDPARLAREKYVTGHIGISYDFGALRKLFTPGATGSP